MYWSYFNISLYVTDVNFDGKPFVSFFLRYGQWRPGVTYVV